LKDLTNSSINRQGNIDLIRLNEGCLSLLWLSYIWEFVIVSIVSLWLMSSLVLFGSLGSNTLNPLCTLQLKPSSSWQGHERHSKRRETLLNNSSLMEVFV